MAGNCGICEQVILVADLINCNGSCKKPFHGKCVNLSNAVMRAIANNANITWNCDTCIGKINVPGDFTEMSKSLVALTETIANNSKVLATLVANSNLAQKSFASVAAAHAGAFPSPSTGSKRRRTDSVFEEMTVPRKTVVVGSGTASTCEIISVEMRKDVVASQLHTSTTEEGLCAYLKEVHKLNDASNAFRCKMLLPNGKKIEDLDWISFKISLTESLYDKVMLSGNWPQGVTVRDFERRPRSRTAGAFLPKTIPPLMDL